MSGELALKLICITLRVTLSCVIFAYFVYIPLKSRFRYGSLATWLMVGCLVFITVAVTILFLSTGIFYNRYSSFGIVFWIASAVTVFCLTIRGSRYEQLFLVLVVLNLYVNIMAIAKVVVDVFPFSFSADAARALVASGGMILYIPLLHSLFIRLYRQVLEFEIKDVFWKMACLLPALTYLIFYVKLIHDYWKSHVSIGAEDIIFSVLWSIATYLLFWVTLQMVVQAHRGVVAAEEARMVSRHLALKEEQYERLLSGFQKSARLRHDWRHHLLTLKGFVDSEDMEGLKNYLKPLLPESDMAAVPVCQNEVVNVILSHYAAKAREAQITMQINVDIPIECGIPSPELCVIFGNLTENALDACLAQENGGREIEVKAKQNGKQLILMVKNTCQNEFYERDGIYYSTKHEGPGIGLSSVKTVAEKYGGIMRAEKREEWFQVYVLLNTET